MSFIEQTYECGNNNLLIGYFKLILIDNNKLILDVVLCNNKHIPTHSKH